MNQKIKVFFIFLAISAVVSVMSFFDVFHGVRSAKLFDSVQPLPLDIIQDADQDGLSDSDESYWDTDFQNPDTDSDGFLDGEEVASGNDPRESASHPLGDSLDSTVYGGLDPNNIDSDYNITDGAGQLIVGAIITGDVTRTADQSKKNQSLDAISLSVIDNFYKIQSFFPLPSVETIENSKENQINYLNGLYEIIKNGLLNFPQKLDTANSLNVQMPYFYAKGEQFRLSFEKTTKLPVPADWLDIHKNILNLLQRLSFSYQAIANYETDVLKATVAFNEIASLNLEAKALMKAVQLKADSNGLTLNNDLYRVLDILYKD